MLRVQSLNLDLRTTPAAPRGRLTKLSPSVSGSERRRESPEEDPFDSVVLQCEPSGRGARPSESASDDWEKDMKLSLRLPNRERIADWKISRGSLGRDCCW